MFVIINPLAGGGNVLKKWKELKIDSDFRINSVEISGNKKIDEKTIHDKISSNEKEFIAVGGDGTLNFLINSIMNYNDPEKINSLKIGSIGVGSSNDFHKPNPEGIKNTIRMKIDFKSAKYRDIGRLKYQENNQTFTKYFLINASIGITAEGNYLFNHPDKILAILKRYNSLLAIYYTIFKTIYDYQNIETLIQLDSEKKIRMNITNLGIVKSPYFSGNLSFNSILELDNGLLDVHLSENLNKVKSIILLGQLSRPKSKKNLIQTKKVNSIKITSEKIFYVEFDGETISTNSAKFDILPQKIMVCES